MWKQKKKEKRLDCFIHCALRLVVLQKKNGTKPRRQENGKQAGTGNFVPDLGTGNRRSQISRISGSKTERLLAILSAGLATALLCQIFF